MISETSSSTTMTLQHPENTTSIGNEDELLHLAIVHGGCQRFGTNYDCYESSPKMLLQSTHNIFLIGHKSWLIAGSNIFLTTTIILRICNYFSTFQKVLDIICKLLVFLIGINFIIASDSIMCKFLSHCIYYERWISRLSSPTMFVDVCTNDNKANWSSMKKSVW